MDDFEESAYEAIGYIQENEEYGYIDAIMNGEIFERDQIALANMRKTWDELSQ